MAKQTEQPTIEKTFDEKFTFTAPPVVNEPKVRVQYIGDLSKGPRFIYGQKLVPGAEYNFPFYVAELCSKEPSLFRIVDKTSVGDQLRELIAPKE